MLTTQALRRCLKISVAYHKFPPALSALNGDAAQRPGSEAYWSAGAAGFASTDASFGLRIAAELQEIKAVIGKAPPLHGTGSTRRVEHTRRWGTRPTSCNTLLHSRRALCTRSYSRSIYRRSWRTEESRSRPARTCTEIVTKWDGSRKRLDPPSTEVLQPVQSGVPRPSIQSE